MHKILAVLLVLLPYIVPPPSSAVTFRLRHTKEPELFLQIGSSGGAVDQVTFAVPPASLGDSNPIQGDLSVLIFTWVRARNASYTVELTVDSSQPLVNGANMLSFRDNIGWTSSDNDIPDGVFSGGVQTLATYRTSRLSYSWHNFYFRNTSVLEAGTYVGRVTYTLTLP